MKKIAYVLFVSIVFFSCKKDNKTINNTNVAYTPISGDLRDYCYFKVGTYWVYEDSITGSIDSVYVTSAYTGQHTITEQDNVGYTGTFDFFNVYVYSTILGGEYHFWTDATFWQAPNAKNIPRVYVENTTIIGGYNETILMFTNEHLNNNVLYPIGGSDITYLGYTSYNSGYYTFQNVKEYSNTVDVVHMGHHTYICIAKNAGIVGCKILPGGTDSVSYSANWKLKSYNIVQ